MMTEDDKPGTGEKPELNTIGMPVPKREQPVDLPHPDRPVGERQDGPGAAPRHADRDDALPPGSTAARRGGRNQGQPEEPDAAHRGQPALFVTGEAQGSGSGAGGGGTGREEEPDPDSAGGGGREKGFAGRR